MIFMWRVITALVLAAMPLWADFAEANDGDPGLPVPHILRVYTDVDLNRQYIEAEYLGTHFFYDADPVGAPIPQPFLRLDIWGFPRPGEWFLEWAKAEAGGAITYRDLGQAKSRYATGINDSQQFGQHESVFGRVVKRDDGLVAYNCFTDDSPYGGVVYGPNGGIGPRFDEIQFRPNCDFLSPPTGVSQPTPTCSDGIDNNRNGLIDAGDPACHSDGNAANPNSYNPQGNEGVPNNPSAPACSDGIDNDGDGLIDSADPGCHSDGNVDNPATYTPTSDNEANNCFYLPKCSPSQPPPPPSGSTVGCPVFAGYQSWSIGTNMCKLYLTFLVSGSTPLGWTTDYWDGFAAHYSIPGGTWIRGSEFTFKQ